MNEATGGKEMSVPVRRGGGCDGGGGREILHPNRLGNLWKPGLRESKVTSTLVRYGLWKQAIGG